jgi:hypothetical protein
LLFSLVYSRGQLFDKTPIPYFAGISYVGSMDTSTKIKPDQAYLQDYYLKRIIALFEPDVVWLTGSAADGTMHSGSDFDFIVDSPHPVDADAITGALDIIPRRHATSEMMEKAVLLYKKEAAE